MAKSRPGDEGNPGIRFSRKPVTLGGQRESGDRARQVFGDGMRGRLCRVTQGGLPEARWAKRPFGRRQSTRMSEEAG
jgi:hypothetical protein